jgi:hypothetical protein
MPMLWVFRRVAELDNRTGWFHVADDKLADRLLRDDLAARRFDPRKRLEKPPRPNAAPVEATAPPPEPMDAPVIPEMERPRKARKAAKE